MTDTDRARLAAILGMLGSAHAGERAAAALQAEAFRKQHGVTWEEVLSPALADPPPTAPIEPDEWPRYGDVLHNNRVNRMPHGWRKGVFLTGFWTAILLGALAFG